jgi:hypothetical protein
MRRLLLVVVVVGRELHMAAAQDMAVMAVEGREARRKQGVWRKPH